MSRLDAEQQQLLATIVELVRSVPREQRHAFHLLQTMGGARLVMPGAASQPTVLASDVRQLEYEGYIRQVSGGRGSTGYDVTPNGFDAYEQHKSAAGTPVQAVQQDMRGYFDSADFSRRHGGAYAKWKQAAEELWSTDTERQLTSVGHHIREAMQAFASEVVALYSISDANPNPDKTIDRLRAALRLAAQRLGDTEAPMLDALLAYWGTTHDLAQRQEHGAAKAERLGWEDARRVVFQTLVVMFELDRAFVRTLGK